MQGPSIDWRNAAFGLAMCALSVAATPTLAGVMLTDSAVFSTNGFGENWNGWIWNTQAPPDDAPNRWNLYYSSSLDPNSPIFINSMNEPTATEVNIDLAVGTHAFLIYGDSVTTDLHPEQHFVLSLYFNGNQSAPDISGLFGSACPAVCAASHWNGLDLLGSSGEQEAGTLQLMSGGLLLELTRFTWSINEDIDLVWPHWDNTSPYSSGNDRPDFVGEIILRVSAVPEPPVALLMGLGLAGIGIGQRMRRIAA